MSETKPNDFPLAQGNLDFLCSVYAAINAMAHRGEIQLLDQASAPFRLAIHFMQSSRDWDLAGAVTAGIDEHHYPELLQVMNWQGWKEPVRNPEIADIQRALKAMGPSGKACVIVSLIWPDDVESNYEDREAIHYTVVTGVDADGLIILDSQGVDRIDRRCGKNYYAHPSVAGPIAFGCLYMIDETP